jgi:dGTPase
MQAYNGELKAFLLQHFYRHWRVKRMAGKARRILSGIFGVYQDDPSQLPPAVQAQAQAASDGAERAICDYIAGMTDRFAIQEHQKLFDPETRV